MSWFTDMLRPGDAPKTPTPAPTQEPRRILEEPTSQSKASSSSPDLEKRLQTDASSTQPTPNNRNKVIFGAGLAFFTLSLLITRRSFARRRLASSPAFYKDGPAHHEEQAAKVSGAMEAMEALNIATINVISVAMMATGGALWYLDINSMAEARRLIRGGLGVDGTGRNEEQVEQEFEEWMATTLARKESKGKVLDAVEEMERRKKEGR